MDCGHPRFICNSEHHCCNSQCHLSFGPSTRLPYLAPVDVSLTRGGTSGSVGTCRFRQDINANIGIEKWPLNEKTEDQVEFRTERKTVDGFTGQVVSVKSCVQWFKATVFPGGTTEGVGVNFSCHRK